MRFRLVRFQLLGFRAGEREEREDGSEQSAAHGRLFQADFGESKWLFRVSRRMLESLAFGRRDAEEEDSSAAGLEGRERVRAEVGPMGRKPS